MSFYVERGKFTLICACDTCAERSETYEADTEARALRAAKTSGWRFYPAQKKCKCPQCVKAMLDRAGKP